MNISLGSALMCVCIEKLLTQYVDMYKLGILCSVYIYYIHDIYHIIYYIYYVACLSQLSTL